MGRPQRWGRNADPSTRALTAPSQGTEQNPSRQLLRMTTGIESSNLRTSLSREFPTPSRLRYNFLVTEIGKLLVWVGGVVVVVGLVLLLGGRLHLPFGRLPGDIVYRSKNTTVYFPIVTSILLSIVLSIILYVLGRLGR